MKKLISTILILGFLNTSLVGQIFFIPIIIPVSDNNIHYKCPSSSSLATEYFEKGTEKSDLNTNASIVYFKGAIEKDSLFCDAYHSLTVCYRKTSNYDSAFKYIDMALKVNASDLWAREIKGLLFMDINDYVSASNHFYSQMELQPEEYLWYFYYSNSLIELNLLDSAQHTAIIMQYHMQQKESIFAQPASFFLQAKIALKKGDYNKAWNAYDQITEYYRNYPEYQYFYGLCFLRKDKPNQRKAKKHIEKSIELGYKHADLETTRKLGIISSTPNTR